MEHRKNHPATNRQSGLELVTLERKDNMPVAYW